MPDISDLKRDLLPYALIALFAGSMPQEYRARVYWLTLVRLVDRLIFEYESAHFQVEMAQSASAAGSPGRLVLPLRAVGHYENCINVLQRAMNFVGRLRSAGYRRSDGKPAVPRGLAVLSKDATTRIDKMRNAIEHAEKDIADGRLAEGQPIFLAIGENGIESGRIIVTYDELASWTKQLQQIALALINCKEPAQAGHDQELRSAA